MKTITIEVDLYEYDELTHESQIKAINEHGDFLNQIGDEPPTEEEVIESIKINEYLFYKDGDLAHMCQYSEDHPTKPGVLEFIFQDKTYLVS